MDHWYIFKQHGQFKSGIAVLATLPLFPRWAWTASVRVLGAVVRPIPQDPRPLILFPSLANLVLLYRARVMGIINTDRLAQLVRASC